MAGGHGGGAVTAGKKRRYGPVEAAFALAKLREYLEAEIAKIEGQLNSDATVNHTLKPKESPRA